MTDPSVTTHAPGCHAWGDRHYLCALQEIERLGRSNQDLVQRLNRADGEAERLHAVAEALVAKLDAMHVHRAYLAIWSVLAAHGIDYRGPSYEGELAALRAVLGRGA